MDCHYEKFLDFWGHKDSNYTHAFIHTENYSEIFENEPDKDALKKQAISHVKDSSMC